MKKLGKIKLNKINFNDCDILQKSELKNIIGGYVGEYGSGGGKSLYCIHEYSDGIRETNYFMSVEAANAFCDFYKAAGFNCRCYSC